MVGRVPAAMLFRLGNMDKASCLGAPPYVISAREGRKAKWLGRYSPRISTVPPRPDREGVLAKRPIVLDGIPQVEGAIREPGSPHHFMVAKPIDRRVRIWHGERLIADTNDAFCLIEVGRRALDPVIYVPPEDIVVRLESLDKTTHCPLKGDASYYAVDGEEVGWAYLEPFDFAAVLARRHAFWAAKVRIEQGG